MFIKTLKLKDFRNIKSAKIEFSSGINIIYGNNAQGKTNIVESIFFSSTARSHRTRIDKELINFENRYANIKVTYYKREFDNNIEVFLKRDERKGIAVNNMPIKRIGELFGELQSVFFSPEDLCIINDSPSERRKFMDIQICQISKIYYYHLHTYYKILKQRNVILKNRSSKELRDSLFAWDSQLIEHGCEIIKTRKWFIENINPIAGEIHSRLTGGNEQLNIVYRPSVFECDFEAKLNKNIDKDIIYGSTSVGPHKDDVSFFINDMDAKTFGSQGQKRTVVLSCKLAEVEIVKREMDDNPILLLDDALSELDSERQNLLFEYIGGIQTIITATGMEDLVDNIKNTAALFYVEGGVIKA